MWYNTHAVSNGLKYSLFMDREIASGKDRENLSGK